MESLVKVSDRYKTLFYGLKRNHPHSATVVHPLVFLIRRLVYACIVLFCLSVPIIGAYLLSWICVAMIGYIIIEQQWEDSLIARQHIVNEIALYLILTIVIICSIPLPASAMSPLGWVLISIVLVTLVFNLAIIAYSSIVHLILYYKRYRSRITNNNIKDWLAEKK